MYTSPKRHDCKRMTTIKVDTPFLNPISIVEETNICRHIMTSFVTNVNHINKTILRPN